MDRLITISRAYLSYFTRKDINVERAYNFIEWVVLVANRSIASNDREIQDKFLIARIWGCDQLIEINNQLKMMLNEPVDFGSADEVEEDSNDESEDNFVYTTILVQSSIQPTPPLFRLDFPPVFRLSAPVQPVPQQYSPIPEDDLINLNNELKVRQVQLWQGTDGILILTAGGKHNYLGKLSSDCREILPLSEEDIRPHQNMNVMGGNCRIACSEFLKSDSVDEHYQLVDIVRCHVSNPCRFPVPAQYSTVE